MQAALEKFEAASYRGISGVIAVDSGIPGPAAALLACTHGNEPAGLLATEYLLSDLKLLHGRVLFILVNPEAARRNLRYIDKNMNRIPSHPSDWAGTVEGARLAELLPLLKEIDGGVLDIHSTSAPAPPMLISVDEAGYEASCCDSMPFRHIVTGISAFISGRFIIEACENATLKLIAECGQHHCPQAASRAIAVSLTFLHRLGMIDAPLSSPPTEKHDCYRAIAPLRLPSGGNYRLLKPITPFEWLERGQKIACNGSHQVEAPVSGHAIMCPQTDGILDCREALLFLCEKTA